MAEIISLLGFISEVITITTNIYHLHSQSKKNVNSVYHLSQKLRLIHSQLDHYREHTETNQDAEKVIETSVLDDIHRDVEVLDKNLREIERNAISPSTFILKYISTYETEEKMKEALQQANHCQQRIETHILGLDIKLYFQSQLQDLMAKTNVEIMENLNNLPEAAKKLMEFFQNMPIDPAVELENVARYRPSRSSPSSRASSDQSALERNPGSVRAIRESDEVIELPILSPENENSSKSISTVDKQSNRKAKIPIVKTLPKQLHQRRNTNLFQKFSVRDRSELSPSNVSPTNSPHPRLLPFGNSSRNMEGTSNRRVSEISSQNSFRQHSTSSSPIEEEDSMVDELESKSLLLISGIPDSVQDMIDEMSRSGVLHFKRNRLIHMITTFWEGWRVNEEDLSLNLQKGFPEKIGEGATGIVYGGTLTLRSNHFQNSSKSINSNSSSGVDTNEHKRLIPVAIKNVSVSSDESGMITAAELLREALIQLSVNHHCVLRTYGVCWPGAFQDFDNSISLRTGMSVDDIKNKETFDDARVITERMSCTLKYALDNGWMSEPRDKYCVLMDIVSALLYLHHHNIVHRDIKPENVLLHIDNRKFIGFAKLADFGSCRRTQTTRINKTYTTTKAQGTPLYLPPEILKDMDSCKTRKSWDVWAYGLFICSVLSPHHSMKINVFDASHLARSGDLGKMARQWARTITDPRMRDLAERCLLDNPDKRPSILQIHLYQCGVLESLQSYMVDPSLLVSHAQSLIKDTHTPEEQLEAMILFQTAASMGHPLAQDTLVTFFKYCERDAQSSAEEREADEEGKIPREQKEYKSLKWNLLPDRNDVFGTQSGDDNSSNNDEEEEKDESILCFEKEEAEGDPEATFKLGYCYQLGVGGLKKDSRKAVEFYNKAIDKGQVKAMVSLGVLTLDGDGVIKNEIAAFDLFSKANDKGDAIAKYHVGCCYFDGRGVRQNRDLAISLFKDASEMKCVAAHLELATCYERGIVVERNVEQVVRLLTKASAGGHPIAAYRLGLRYENGEGVERDVRKAYELYYQAAVDKNRNALYKLGEMYQYGRGVKKDWKAAGRYYDLAAKNGNPRAQWRLALFTEKGFGQIIRNIPNALELYKKAIDNGYWGVF